MKKKTLQDEIKEFARSFYYVGMAHAKSTNNFDNFEKAWDNIFEILDVVDKWVYGRLYFKVEFPKLYEVFDKNGR